jgi:hypothetical protein
MTRIDEAVAYFKQGFSCSQALMAAYAPSLGLDRDTALKIASACRGENNLICFLPAREGFC